MTEAKYEAKGANYRLLLQNIHNNFAPRSYLEIGTHSGHTLDFVKCPSICVDPLFRLDVSPTSTRAVTMFFQLTSQRFFQDYRPVSLLGRPMDLVFLDGLHEAETLLRDFINAEAVCQPNSIIAIHDCLPMHETAARRVKGGGPWTGDVWKVVPILRKYRPDLDVFVFDAAPTGLVCCTNLNPSSNVLNEKWSEIWRDWRNADIETHGYDRMIAESDIISTHLVKDSSSMRKYFWLG